MTNKRLLWISFASIAIIGAIHMFGTAFYLYWGNVWFDGLAHFVGGLSVALLCMWIWFESGLFERSKPSKREAMIYSLLFAMVIGLGWEFFEYAYGIAVPLGGNYPLDTFHDLLFDFLGGIVAGIISRNSKLYA